MFQNSDNLSYVSYLIHSPLHHQNHESFFQNQSENYYMMYDNDFEGLQGRHGFFLSTLVTKTFNQKHYFIHFIIGFYFYAITS